MSICLAAIGLGISSDARVVATQYATERAQFGSLIAQKQAIQNYVAQALTEVEALRHLVYYTAWLSDQGGDISLGASIVKAFGARVSRSVTNRMLQVMGGYGFMEDYPMARKYRDARLLGIIGGSTEIHHVRIAQKVFAELDVEVAL
jgi:acyl-CoA dehydrogenase